LREDGCPFDAAATPEVTGREGLLREPARSSRDRAVVANAHYPVLENPPAFNAVLEDFLTRS
jgi:hypothetical protein